MISVARFLMRILKLVLIRIQMYLTCYLSYFILKINRVDIGAGFSSAGMPRIYIHKNGSFYIGEKFRMNNTSHSNPIGRNARCLFRVDDGAELSIGTNVGMSGVSIVCQEEIRIGDNVRIGGNTCIYDTDFHSLDPMDRMSRKHDKENTIKRKITISDNVFIGAHCTVLKGVSIGKNSIIGAGALVASDIPENEVWVGNPAKFIKKVSSP